MAITDIEISEELMTNAPSIKYSGNEGPKSPQEQQMMMEQMMMAQLEEEYSKYVDDAIEQGIEPMTLQQFMEQAMAEARQPAAYGGIMGDDGRRQYGIGSFFQKAKDKFVDDIIPNEIKDNPLLTAAAIAAGDYYLNDRTYLNPVIDAVMGEQTEAGEKGITREGGILGGLRNILGTRTGEDKTLGGDILSGLAKNIIPIAGGLAAGLFTKATDDGTTGGQPDLGTGLALADLKKSANLLNQAQGMQAGLNFLPTVASRKYSPEEMAVIYSQGAANGGRIGKAEGGILDLGGMEKDYRNTGGFVDIGEYEKKDDVPARLSVNEFVMTADAVRGMGNGDIDLGAKRMEDLMSRMETKGKKGAQQMFDVSERLREVI